LEVLILRDFKSLFPEVLIMLDFKSLFSEVLILVGFKPFIISELWEFEKIIELLIPGALGRVMCTNGWIWAGEIGLGQGGMANGGYLTIRCRGTKRRGFVRRDPGGRNV
jgi:hypothetical protein